MPQLGKDLRFKFRQMNVEEAFTKAKTDMIYLSEGVLASSEVRSERGLDSAGVVAMQPTTPNVNLSGGKNVDKKEESRRTDKRNIKGVGKSNKPSGNIKGKRDTTKKEEIVEVVA